MKTFIVRQAALADLDEIAPLFDAYRQFYGAPSDMGAARKFLLERFNHAESTLFIALQEETGLGFAQLYPAFSSALLARTFILNDLYVRESARRQGVGSRLMAAAIEYGTQLGAVRLTLATAVTNKEAQALYESAGWQRDEKFLTYHYAAAR